MTPERPRPGATDDTGTPAYGLVTRPSRASAARARTCEVCRLTFDGDGRATRRTVGRLTLDDASDAAWLAMALRLGFGDNHAYGYFAGWLEVALDASNNFIARFCGNGGGSRMRLATAAYQPTGNTRPTFVGFSGFPTTGSGVRVLLRNWRRIY